MLRASGNLPITKRIPCLLCIFVALSQVGLEPGSAHEFWTWRAFPGEDASAFIAVVIDRILEAARNETSDGRAGEVEHTERTSKIIARMETMNGQPSIALTF